jgi:hypothetical protein
MAMTPEEMDALVDAHFAFEAADDVDGVMGTLAEGAEHEVVPSPFGVVADPARQREYYELLFRSLRGERVEPLRRYYGDDVLIDETLWHGTVVDGAPFLCTGACSMSSSSRAARSAASRCGATSPRSSASSDAR